MHAISVDSDQSAHMRRLIRDFTVYILMYIECIISGQNKNENNKNVWMCMLIEFVLSGIRLMLVETCHCLFFCVELKNGNSDFLQCIE